MPLARIVLAGVNILLAIVFVWLASASWGKRYAWSYAVFRHDLAVRGLPVDANEPDENGDAIAEHLTERTLQDVLKGGPVVKTQKDEVEARFKQLRGELEGGDEAARRQRGIELLQHLARTGGERESAANLKTEELAPAFEAAFSAARTGKDSAGKELNY